MNKAYSMIQRVERQRHVTHTTIVSKEVAACITKTSSGDLGDLENVAALVAKGRGRRDMRKPKVTKVCDYCQKPGHDRDQCFKLIGTLSGMMILKGERSRVVPGWLLMWKVLLMDKKHL